MATLQALDDQIERFVVERQVGEGGMGTVFRALDEETGRPVALQLLQVHGSSQEADRFAREASLLAELRHPHIVAGVAHGTSRAGRPYLAMEWLDGEDLAQLLARRRLGFASCVALLHGVSAAL